MLYPEKLYLRYEEETKAFPGKQKLRELINTKPALQKNAEWNSSR